MKLVLYLQKNPGYYSIVQLLNKYGKESIPPFEIVKTNVEKRFIAEQKNKIIEQYLKEIYSQNEIEIRK